MSLLKKMHSKLATKAWVHYHTDFDVPETLYGPFPSREFEEVLESIPPSPQVMVLKPLTLCNARGVRILHQPTQGVWANPWVGGSSSLKELREDVFKEVRGFLEHGRFIIEEYVRSHGSLSRMAPLPDASPVLRNVYWGDRFIGGLIHLPTLTSGGVGNLAKKANWMAFDAQGAIQRVPFTEYRSWGTSPYKELELPDYETWIKCKIRNWSTTKTGINSQIVPAVMQGLNDMEKPFWAVDGILNEAERFVIVEMEYPPGPVFKRVKPFME